MVVPTAYLETVKVFVFYPTFKIINFPTDYNKYLNLL